MSYPDETVQATVDLSSRYLKDRFLPDSAIDVMDEAGAEIKLTGDGIARLEVSVGDLERLICRMAKIPYRSVKREDKALLKSLGEDLKKTIFGQDDAIKEVGTRLN